MKLKKPGKMFRCRPSDICEVMSEALDIATRYTDALHISLDMDALDPQVAPGVGTPVHGGLTYREAHTAMEIVSDSYLISSLEVVEVNPITLLVSAIRGIMENDVAFQDIGWVLLISALLLAIFVPLTMQLYRRKS